MIATISVGLLSGMNLETIMTTFISGMGNNSETALSYILLGTFAATMAYSGLTDKLTKKITGLVSNNKYLLNRFATL